MQGGGAERVAALLCNAWVSQGHDVTLVPTFSGRGTCVYDLDARVRLLYLADVVGKQGTSLTLKLGRLRAIRSMIRQKAPDAVLSFLTHVNVAVLLAALGLRVPVVVAERTYPPAMPVGALLSRLRRLTYQRARAVVMQTARGEQWLSKDIRNATGIIIANPCVHPLPISQPIVEPADHLPVGRRVILAVGRISEEKGYTALVAAFAALAASFRDWDLVILGDGPQRESLEHQIGMLGLAARVKLPGRVGNLHDWYPKADVYAMSSRFEGFPNTLMEAMAYGVPPVSFDCKTGPSDLIQDGVNGRLVPVDSGGEGLQAALRGMMEDEWKRQAMGDAARQVRERYRFSRIISAWNSVLGL